MEKEAANSTFDDLTSQLRPCPSIAVKQYLGCLAPTHAMSSCHGSFGHPLSIWEVAQMIYILSDTVYTTAQSS
jgi:hypothetical protein